MTIQPFKKITPKTCPNCGNETLMLRDIYNCLHNVTESYDQVPLKSFVCPDCRVSFMIHWVGGKPYPVMDRVMDAYLRGTILHN